MINKDVWEHIQPYFNRGEKWGDPDRMDPLTLYTLYEARKKIGLPFHIHCGTQGRHVKGSFHYKGLAVDLHIGNGNIHVFDQFLMIERLNLFSGIGIYPDWNNPGLHLDVGGGPKRPGRWMRKLENGSRVDLPLNVENIKKLL